MNQKELTQKLIAAAAAYYAGKSSGMSDLKFDKAVEKLRQMEAESGIVYPGSPTQNVGAEVVSELKKVRHEQPALSLDKVKYKDRENLKNWFGGRPAVMSWKCDGLTVVATYEGGKFAQAVTRGDGIEGSDITHNARFFYGLPQTIPYDGKLIVRGEAMMTYEEFDRVNNEAEGVYENPRNLAAATIQMLDANESRKRKIYFKAFELVTPEPEYPEYSSISEKIRAGNNLNIAYMQDRLTWLEYLGFDVVEHECVDASDLLDKIEEWKEDLQSLKYPTDGLVFSYQDLEEGWSLGSTGHHPRWAMALKWTDETQTTTIRDIKWSVGKTGVITPVAIFDTVRLGLGSDVSRASLHNISIMESLAGAEDAGIMMIGAKAEVYLANMIIPQVFSVTPDAETTPVVIPGHCPVCGGITRIREENGIQTLHCENAKCAAQTVGKLMNTFGKDGLFVKGLGESQLQDLLEYGLIRDAVDVYTLSKRVDSDPEMSHALAHMLSKDGWGAKKWKNLLDAIEASRETTLQKFLYSLNIPLLGNDLSKKLSKFWHDDIESFITFIVGVDEKAGDDESFGALRAFSWLIAIDGVGDEKANNVINWAEKLISDRKAYQRFLDLCDELKFSGKDQGTTDQPLVGMTFVITGTVHDYKNRDEFKASVEARGGKVAGSVSKNTTALVNNDVTSTSGKNQKAKELGIEIISEDEFIARYGK